MSSPIRVLILEQEDSFRQMICTSIDQAEGLLIVGKTGGDQEAGKWILRPHPDVVLVGVETIDPEQVLNIAHVAAQYPQSRLLVWGHNVGQEALILDLFKSGIWGYVEGPASQLAQIVEAIHTINRGGVILSPRMARLMLDKIAQTVSRNALSEDKGGEYELSVEMLQTLLRSESEDCGTNTLEDERPTFCGEHE